MNTALAPSKLTVKNGPQSDGTFFTKSIAPRSVIRTNISAHFPNTIEEA